MKQLFIQFRGIIGILGSGLTISLDGHEHDVRIDNVVAYNNSGMGK